MKQVNIFQAKTELSKLIDSLERKEEDHIIIVRDGTPVALLTLYTSEGGRRKLGIFNGKYNIPDDIDEYSTEFIL